MTDRTEAKPDVFEQRRRANEHLEYSGTEEGTPDFGEMRKTRENFLTGREPDAETFKSERDAYEALEARANEEAEQKRFESENEKQSVDAELRQRVGHLRADKESGEEVQFLRGERTS